MKAGLVVLILCGSFLAARAQNTDSGSPPSAEPVVALAATGIDGVSSAPSLPTDFLGLADLRANTNADIQNLEREIRSLEDQQIPKARNEQNRVEQLKQEIAQLESNKDSKDPAGDARKLAAAQIELRFHPDNPPSIDAMNAKLGADKVTVEQKRQLAAKVQAAIASMLSPQQEFKRTMSMTFAGLIGVVIIGFFVVSMRDGKIRQAIFSGEAGIQFLTLFSLVIAIILFGITQILEGKELAALLGGLSGYILGRSSPKTPPADPAA